MSAKFCHRHINAGQKMSEEKPSQANNSSADDKISSGSIKDAFKEVKEVEEIIKSLNHVYKNQIAVEMAVERFQCK